VPDVDCEGIFPLRLPARLRVRTGGGEEHEVFIRSSRGGPGHPLSDDELQLKFDLNASRRLSPDQVDSLRALVLEFERAASPALLLQTAARRTPALR
jgi:hypothetical protein